MKGLMIILALIISGIIFVSSISHGRDNQEMCMFFNNTRIKCGLVQVEYQDGILTTYDNKGQEETFRISPSQEKNYYFIYPLYDVEMRLHKGILESRSSRDFEPWKNIRDDEEGL